MPAIYVPDLLVRLPSYLAYDGKSIPATPAQLKLVEDAAQGAADVWVPMVLCDDMRREAVRVRIGPDTNFLLERFRETTYPFPSGSVLKPAMSPDMLQEFVGATVSPDILAQLAEAKTLLGNFNAELAKFRSREDIDAYLKLLALRNTVSSSVQSTPQIETVGDGEPVYAGIGTTGKHQVKSLKAGSGIHLLALGGNILVSREAAATELPAFSSAADGAGVVNTFALAHRRDSQNNALITKSLWYDPLHFESSELNGTISVSLKHLPYSTATPGELRTSIPTADTATFRYDASQFSTDALVFFTVEGLLGTPSSATRFSLFWELSTGSTQPIFSSWDSGGTAATIRPSTAIQLALQVTGTSLPSTVVSLPVIRFIKLGRV